MIFCCLPRAVEQYDVAEILYCQAAPVIRFPRWLETVLADTGDSDKMARWILRAQHLILLLYYERSTIIIVYRRGTTVNPALDNSRARKQHSKGLDISADPCHNFRG